ncbi:MAG: hypothetical protein IKV79_05600 [Oscillospiraceae bacterium]|nr:hypothetical protein [Oscillospiraceae bacterium]
MKKQRSKINWERHTPPGFDYETERSLFIAALIISVLWSLSFFARFFDAVIYLGEWHNAPYFYELLGNAFFCFPIAIALMLSSIAINYAHYHSGSKSIYLMRRLPNRWERHRRCIEIPLASASITFLTAIIIVFIYYLIYMFWINKHGYHPYANQLKLLLENWRVM